ncbi:MAG: FecR domain-containing protein [Oligoflexia bacterium]|nr:FecR domain-containing protein [Oligoflexia bacterium]
MRSSSRSISASFLLSAIAALSLGVFCPSTRASEQVGTITQAEGSVKLFTDPAKKLHGDSEGDSGARALFEGEYYRVRDAKVGDRVQQGNIVRTALGAKARVVFENGDQYNVGPGTAYRVFWNKDSKEAKQANTKVELMYGKLRGVVAKGGPRSRLTVKTKTATMGVRGTDFFIADGGDSGTEVSILRGAVEVKPENPKAKPIEVKAGFSAAVAPPAPPKAVPSEDSAEREAAKPEPVAVAPVIELRKTTQEELVGIQKSSEIKALKKEDLQAAPEVAKIVEKLETKAVETVINDVKAADPKLFAQLQGKQFTSTEEINKASVQNIFKEAPKAPEKRKPYKSELEDLSGDAYQKYFKEVE